MGERGGWYVYSGVADKEQISKWQCLRFPRQCDKEFLNCFVSHTHTHSHVDNRQSTAHEVADGKLWKTGETEKNLIEKLTLLIIAKMMVK